VKLTLLLADWAEVLNGKLYVMGGGWTETGPGPGPSALAAVFEVPWDETNRKHTVKFQLLDGDDQPVTIAGPMGAQRVEVAAEFEVGRPPGSTPGSSFNVPMAVNLGPLPLPPGKVYVWRCSIDDKVNEQLVTFRTRTAPPRSSV
jgi:Family of unknown function (DUF6941)